MKASKKQDSPLPGDWLEQLFEKADFERSYASLRGLKHFYVEAWRGHLRAEQLRFDAAWKHFDKAYSLASDVEENIPNLVRQFLLNIWCFENALAEAPIGDTVTEVPEAWIPELPPEILDEYPEVRLVIQMRRRSEASLRLHLGQYSDAAEIFGELIEEGSEDKGMIDQGNLTSYYLGLAASEYNLEFREKALKNLENAGLAITTSGKTWTRARNASTIQAFYKFLKMDDEAASWDSFMENLDCPKATKDLYRKRAAMVLSRCVEKSQLLLV